MSKPYEHARNSVKEFGGKYIDYIKIHRLMDSSKEIIADNRHRILTHNTWFVQKILPMIFGEYIKNSDGNEVSVTDLGQQHLLEDFGSFIPTAQDYLNECEYKSWMNGVSKPKSQKGIDLLELAKSMQNPEKHVISN